VKGKKIYEAKSLHKVEHYITLNKNIQAPLVSICLYPKESLLNREGQWKRRVVPGKRCFQSLSIKQFEEKCLNYHSLIMMTLQWQSKRPCGFYFNHEMFRSFFHSSNSWENKVVSLKQTWVPFKTGQRWRHESLRWLTHFPLHWARSWYLKKSLNF
jgi:hypothetical protein